MRLWKKVILIAVLNLIPAPNIEISVKVDIDDDDKADLVVTWEDFDLDIVKN